MSRGDIEKSVDDFLELLKVADRAIIGKRYKGITQDHQYRGTLKDVLVKYHEKLELKNG